MSEERILLEHILTTLDQFHEVSRSTSTSLADLSARLAAQEELLKRINAALHEGANGRASIVTRLELLEQPQTEDEAHLEDVKGKWRTAAIIAPGGLALIAEGIHLLWKAVAR